MSKQMPVDGEKPLEQIAGDDVAIVIPMLNEAAIMPRLLRLLKVLAPAPAEIIAVDGGSHDETVALVNRDDLRWSRSKNL